MVQTTEIEVSLSQVSRPKTGELIHKIYTQKTPYSTRLDVHFDHIIVFHAKVNWGVVWADFIPIENENQTLRVDFKFVRIHFEKSLKLVIL